jgi:hypothetical protein
MGLKKMLWTAGWWFKGLIFKIDSELQFNDTANPEIDSSGGPFVWLVKTNTSSTFILEDKVTGEKILKIDSDSKTATLLAAYSGVGFDSNKITFTAQSANYNANANDWIDMTTGATDKTNTFPASPAVDDIIKVSKADAGAGNVIQDGNGKNINGAATDTIVGQYTTKTYQYNGTEWRKF